MAEKNSGSRPSSVAETKFFAHSVEGKDMSHWQPLADHLHAVGDHAALCAAVFGAAHLAKTEGDLHDLGKYTDDFLEMIKGKAISVDHSTWGAKVACERYGPLGYLIAYGIAGHHAGLANGLERGERSSLKERLERSLPNLDACWQREIQLPSELKPPEGFSPRKETSQFQLTFLARMLFSCLVDADFLDTEAFYQRAEGHPSGRTAERPTLEALREKLDERLRDFVPDSPVNQLRAEILRHVRGEAVRDKGLFSLTVPTGGGKTLASLAFALDHAIQHGLRRVIFVIPFTSIVEQNAAVFREAFGSLGEAAVLEHHSAYVEDKQDREAREKVRLAMENWDAPIIVTTAVQFFESLFAARPSHCRKLHNMAGSVVILDEAQTMPLKVLRPCVAAIDELARNYRSSVVLCTATQPALNAPDFIGGLEQVRELAPQPEKLFEQLRRVQVRHIGLLSDDALAAQLCERQQVLCIVNNRRHAQAIYQAIADRAGSCHLTTLMCAKHRSAVLAEVRRRLLAGEPCRLVSTSLIEAGVDVDFPMVLRAEAGLDSVAQAAGRCNREGKRSWRESEVLVFTTEEAWKPPPELKQFAEAGQEIFRSHQEDLLSPAAIEAYFRLLYWKKGDQALDAKNLLGMVRSSRVESLPMESLAANFRMIENAQQGVIIPWDDSARDALEDLLHVPFASGTARRLQPYLVQLQQGPFNALQRAGAIHAVAPEKWGEQFMVLANVSLYDPYRGLTWDWDDPNFLRVDQLTW